MSAGFSMAVSGPGRGFGRVSMSISVIVVPPAMMMGLEHRLVPEFAVHPYGQIAESLRA